MFKNNKTEGILAHFACTLKFIAQNMRNTENLSGVILNYNEHQTAQTKQLAVFK